jgi:hypothetical protein
MLLVVGHRKAFRGQQILGGNFAFLDARFNDTGPALLWAARVDGGLAPKKVANPQWWRRNLPVERFSVRARMKIGLSKADSASKGVV